MVAGAAVWREQGWHIEEMWADVGPHQTVAVLCAAADRFQAQHTPGGCTRSNTAPTLTGFAADSSMAYIFPMQHIAISSYLADEAGADAVEAAAVQQGGALREARDSGF